MERHVHSWTIVSVSYKCSTIKTKHPAYWSSPQGLLVAIKLFYCQCITHLKITREDAITSPSSLHIVLFLFLFNFPPYRLYGFFQIIPFAMICHIIYPSGTSMYIQLSIQTSKISQKDNIVDTKTKVETYCEITWSFPLLEAFVAFHTNIR